MSQSLTFKVSSALKNIIGSDLINDDFIAVFELVKNAYDAHATRVDVIFEDIYSGNGKIIIKDNGKGMNYDDLLNKWLFVAYSAKKEGTEEDDYDYRNKIKVKRAYAGAKGIGRFSCDRLGKILTLQTTKDEPNAKTETIITDWEKFEGDLKDEFVDISVLHDTIDIPDANSGTILEISNLRSEWNRPKFLKLKDDLAKLINPNVDNQHDVFSVYITVKDELERDSKEERDIVNGEVKNLIFETLDFKTTKIVSKVYSKEDKKIETTVSEGGRLVYKIIELNPLEHLHDIEYVMYFLNRSAKLTFSRRMGIQPVEYGHIFMYKNGLRVYPYGERGEDPLKMDNRKAQGYNRYLGTRETIGYISINDPNEDLRETSSRGDGLIKTSAYHALTEWFYTTLRRLEKYGLEIISWGNDLSNEDYINLDDDDKQDALKELIGNLTRSKNLISYELAPEIFDILERKQEKSAKTSLNEITKKIESDQFDKNEVLKSIRQVEHSLDRLKQSKDEAENEAFQKLIENEQLSKEIDQITAESLFDKSIVGREKKDLLSLQHQIIHSAGNITWSLDMIIDAINNNEPKDQIIENIKDISLEVQRIVSASRYVTNAGFNTEAERITKDVIQFINEYITNIYIPATSFIHQRRPIKITVDNPHSLVKSLKFRPFEITVILDNLFSNSRKANATEINLEWFKDDSYLCLLFKDNGNGIPNEIKEKIFDFRYSNTDGSGIGLYHVKDLLSKYNSIIEVNTQTNIGVEFLIKIPL